MTWLDALGWGGSALLILSLALSNVLRFRALNLVASVVLTVFNALLGIWPMVAMNAVIAGLNVWHLVRLLRDRDDERTYEVVAVDPDAEYLTHLLRVHGPDIQRHNPGFDWAAVAAARARRWAFLVLRADETVGIVLLSDEHAGHGAGAAAGGAGGGTDGGVARVELDYVTPRFRDLSVGTFVYRGSSRLAELGMRRLVANERMVDREGYFRGVGFSAEGTDLVRDVAAARDDAPRTRG